MPLPALPPVVSAADTVPEISQYLVRCADPSLVLGQKDEYNMLFAWEDLEGWFNTPSIEVSVVGRGLSDMSVASNRFPRQARNVTIHGICHFNNHDDGFTARERLVSAWDSPNDTFDMIVEEPTPKRLPVRTAGQIEAPWERPMLSFKFTIPLVAPIPYKQGLDVRTGLTRPTSEMDSLYQTFPWTFPLDFDNLGIDVGVINLYNAGNAESYPKISIQGPTPSGWKVTNSTTNTTFQVLMEVNEGQTMVIDTGMQTVRVNDFPVSARRVGDWPILQPGNNVFFYTAPSPGGDTSVLSVTGNSAWK